jgi:site-specific DNA-cytosine methylase
MKVLYLASHIANYENYNITYQDISGKRDIDGDMMDVNLDPYDVIIATPPCNYYSRANYRRETSKYSQATKHLLPGILIKLNNQNKPYIIENVINRSIMNENGLYNLADYVYEIGRHTYWTNIPFNMSNKKYSSERIQDTPKHLRQGGNQVKDVITYWLDIVKDLI